MIIDSHTHLGNVGFIPVEGVINAWVPGHARAARWIAWLLNHLVERQYKSRIESHIAVVHAELQRPMRIVAKTEPDLIARVVYAIPEDVLDGLRPLIDDIKSVEQRGERTVSDAVRAESRARLGRRLSGDLSADDRLVLDELLRGVDLGDDVRSRTIIENWDWTELIEWFLMLLQHERRLFEAMQSFWETRPEFQLAAHQHLDLNPHFAIDGNPDSLYPYHEQIDRMLAVTQQDDPFPLEVLVGFSPFRKDGLDLVKHWLGKGCVGVKFYPPCGFRPINNTAADIDPRAGVSYTDVNTRNIELFEFCVANKVPVFTHCAPGGLELVPNKSGCLSDPAGWEQVLRTTGLETLRLCLSHAGGANEWLADPRNPPTLACSQAFLAKSVELCTAFDNVYCDFAFFDGLFENKKTIRWFVQRFEGAVKANAKFAKRACFGTDWHLVARKPNAPAYVRVFEELLAKSGTLAPYSDDILRANFLAFLG